MARVAVIGGGPAGLLAAREICGRGLKAHVFEEDSEIGSPERCGGLLSLKGLRMISAPRPMKYVLNLVRGAVFHSPSGHEFELDAGRWVAAVISRRRFDQMLGALFEVLQKSLRDRGEIGIILTEEYFRFNSRVDLKQAASGAENQIKWSGDLGQVELFTAEDIIRQRGPAEGNNRRHFPMPAGTAGLYQIIVFHPR